MYESTTTTGTKKGPFLHWHLVSCYAVYTINPTQFHTKQKQDFMELLKIVVCFIALQNYLFVHGTVKWCSDDTDWVMLQLQLGATNHRAIRFVPDCLR